jgi:anaerobic C4-dicarboxylate transporter DcuA/anaerobic C4-dicarboxylate transporter DcuB
VDNLALIVHGLIVIGCIYMGVQVTAMWPAVMGMYFLPVNGSQIATVAFDQMGTTRIGTEVLRHSFLVPVLIFIVVAMLIAFPISALA